MLFVAICKVVNYVLIFAASCMQTSDFFCLFVSSADVVGVLPIVEGGGRSGQACLLLFCLFWLTLAPLDTTCFSSLVTACRLCRGWIQSDEP